MGAKLSRSKLAKHTARRIIAGADAEAIKELAAYLIEEGRTRETDLVVRAIYEELEHSGVVVTHVTSAEAIDSEIKAELSRLIGADKLVIRETVEPSILGGVLVQTPSKVLDASFRRRLAKLRESKV